MEHYGYKYERLQTKFEGSNNRLVFNEMQFHRTRIEGRICTTRNGYDLRCLPNEDGSSGTLHF
jgi:hypothetical protein